jgi:hypothetical protein
MPIEHRLSSSRNREDMKGTKSMKRSWGKQWNG